MPYFILQKKSIYLIVVIAIIYQCNSIKETKNRTEETKSNSNQLITSEITLLDSGDIEKLLVICLVNESIYFNGVEFNGDYFKKEINAFFYNGILNEEIDIFHIILFHSDIEMEAYNGYYKIIESISSKYLNDESSSKFGKKFSELSRYEKIEMNFKVLVNGFQKKTINNFNIPRQLKCP